jgi:hypothetical protein
MTFQAAFLIRVAVFAQHVLNNTALLMPPQFFQLRIGDEMVRNPFLDPSVRGPEVGVLVHSFRGM